MFPQHWTCVNQDNEEEYDHMVFCVKHPAHKYDVQVNVQHVMPVPVVELVHAAGGVAARQ